MEMAMEATDELGMQVERLAAAAGELERAAERLRAIDVAAVGSREAELEERLRAAEATIAGLQASAAAAAAAQPSGRKTVASGVAQLMAKAGIAAETQAGALDAALTGLSLEQRIAVKAQMLRAGLIG